jgi:hypothetical protein
LPVNTTTGTSAARAVVAHALEHLEARHVRQPQVEHGAVVGVIAQLVERLLPRADGMDLDVVVAEQGGDADLLGLVVLDHEQAARRGLA